MGVCAVTVRIRWVALEEGDGGFAVETPAGITLVLDPALNQAQRVLLCAELLTDEEFASMFVSASA